MEFDVINKKYHREESCWVIAEKDALHLMANLWKSQAFENSTSGQDKELIFIFLYSLSQFDNKIL